MKKIPYEELDKHFTSAKTFVSSNNIRLPRKRKKSLNKIIDSLQWPLPQLVRKYPLDTKLWFMMEYTHPNYKRFLIKQVCKSETNWDWRRYKKFL